MLQIPTWQRRAARGGLYSRQVDGEPRRRDTPPRTPEEAADMAMRRDSSVEAMNRYGVWREG